VDTPFDPSPRLRAVRHAATIPLAVMAVAAALVLAACSGSAATPVPSAEPSALPSTAPSVEPSPSPAFPVSLVDDEGNTVELAAEPQRIVSLTPATTETLFAIGAGDRVVATTDFDDYPPEAVDLPDVASFTSVDVEGIVGLEADLVIAGGNFFNDPEALDQLRGLGIPVLVVYAPDVETVLTDIELVGRAVGLPDEAAELTAGMRADIEAVERSVEGLEAPRVFYELDATSAIYGPADDSFLEEMIALAGGDPITTGSPTVFEIPIERLVAEDPEVILLGDAAYGVTADQVAARPGWDVMTAVKVGAVRPVDDVIITRPGPRLTEGLRALALAIHPEIASAAVTAVR
jgi:iron complex transport system substrate-binding protein